MVILGKRERRIEIINFGSKELVVENKELFLRIFKWIEVKKKDKRIYFIIEEFV